MVSPDHLGLLPALTPLAAHSLITAMKNMFCIMYLYTNLFKKTDFEYITQAQTVYFPCT